MSPFVLEMLDRGMTDDGNTDDDLARDLGFALWRSRFRLKRGQDIDACLFVARAVVEHLKRYGLRFDHPPSLARTSSPGAREVR
jgi:hypothetical protein